MTLPLRIADCRKEASKPLRGAAWLAEFSEDVVYDYLWGDPVAVLCQRYGKSRPVIHKPLRAAGALPGRGKYPRTDYHKALCARLRSLHSISSSNPIVCRGRCAPKVKGEPLTGVWPWSLGAAHFQDGVKI